MKTYTMYFRRAGDEEIRFEPVLCANDLDAIRKARKLLADSAEVDSIDVFFGDERIVTVS